MAEKMRRTKKHTAKGLAGTLADDAASGLTEGIKSIVQSLELVDRNLVLFPNGITKIGLTVRMSGNEFTIDIEGPQGHGQAEISSFVASTELVFTISERVGRKARGTLVWANKGLSSRAVSGDSGHDAINI